MYNEFVILGPKNDPAKIRDLDPVTALTKIAAAGHAFVSRGDDSGTHKREVSLWKASGGRPEWDDYMECGQGMGSTLIMADEKRTYVLSDRGTYLKFKGKIDLIPLARSANSLLNPYAVIVVSAKKHPKINVRLANAFVEFLVSQKTQQRIRQHRVAGQQMFYPTRLGTSE